jgi:predicted nucleic acid-binding protein
MPDDLYLVDTSAWIFALRPRPIEAIKERLTSLLETDQVATTGIIVLELMGGVQEEREGHRLKQRLGGVHYFATPEPTWERAAWLAWRLRRRGVTIPFTDALIASIAIEQNAVVLHADSDFDRITQHEGLRVESYVSAIAAHNNP